MSPGRGRLWSLFLAALTLVSVLLAGPSIARADAFDDALQKFLTDSYADTEAGVTALGAGGDVRAFAVVKPSRTASFSPIPRAAVC